MWVLFLFSLQAQWQQEIQSEPVYTEQLKNHHVLFVGGVMNELAEYTTGYFTDSRDCVEQELGGQSSYWGPSSKNSIPENAEILNGHILKTYFETQKPLILVGHSKGAAEILYVILEHPELILDGLVERVILIQGSMGGSRIANDPARWLGHAILKQLTEFDTESLSESGAKKVFDAAFEQYQAKIDQTAHEQVSGKIFYLRSALELNRHSYFVQLILKLSQYDLEIEECGPSDGFLTTCSQLDSRIGVDLGIVEADHLSLVLSWVGLSKKERRALMRAVFKKII